MVKKMLALALLALSAASLVAIDIPPPDCFPCAHSTSVSR